MTTSRLQNIRGRTNSQSLKIFSCLKIDRDREDMLNIRKKHEPFVKVMSFEA